MARLTIALDAMGGDDAPDIVLKGANIARERHENVDFLFFGPQDLLTSKLSSLKKLRKVSTIHHTDSVITNDMKPAAALRSGRDSSMRLAINAVHQGEAQGIVSAGNTGALMAMSKFVLGTLPGIHRPAITSFVPTERGESVMLDLGANIECTAENLVQFAIMGEVFARHVFGWVEPTIGLLNIGIEDMKGRDEIKEAAVILKRMSEATSEHQVNFKGFIEGNDICSGAADVIVTDGFTGNVALKAMEGAARFYGIALKHFLNSSYLAKIGYIIGRHAFNSMRVRLDPRRYNGAVFLGLNGTVVKSHGGTDALGFANAIGVAIDMVTHQFVDHAREEIAHLGSLFHPLENKD